MPNGGWFLALVVMASLTACSTGAGTDADAPTTLRSTSAAGSEAIKDASGAKKPSPASSSSAATAKPAQAAKAEPKSADRCRSTALSIVRQERRPSIGITTPQESPIIGFTLTNRGSQTCSLTGWPDLTLRGDGTVMVCEGAGTGCQPGPKDRESLQRVDMRRLPIKVQEITLKPKQWAMFAVVWTGDGVCFEKQPYALDVRLPNDGRILRVVDPGLCARPLSYTPIMIPA
jgi:hypothetical protein